MCGWVLGRRGSWWRLGGVSFLGWACTGLGGGAPLGEVAEFSLGARTGGRACCSTTWCSAVGKRVVRRAGGQAAGAGSAKHPTLVQPRTRAPSASQV